VAATGAAARSAVGSVVHEVAPQLLARASTCQRLRRSSTSDLPLSSGTKSSTRTKRATMRAPY
jgi:hypothetical protein